MKSKIKLIQSEKGKQLVLLNFNKYRHIRTRKDGMHKCLCTVRTCYASIVTDAHKTSIVSIIGKHTHEPNSDVKIERQILRENCKSQVEDGILTRPIKIIRQELMKNVSCNFEMKDILSVRKAMYVKKKKLYSQCPNSINDAIPTSVIKDEK
jgi:hypothetical protein